MQKYQLPHWDLILFSMYKKTRVFPMGFLVNVTRSLLADIKTIQLQWYRHVQRMEEGRLPKEVMKWHPPARRKRGNTKLTWVEGIRGLMGEKGLMEEDWNDRSNWRKKII